MQVVGYRFPLASAHGKACFLSGREVGYGIKPGSRRRRRVVVQILVPFWVLIIIRHQIFRDPKRDPNFDNYPRRRRPVCLAHPDSLQPLNHRSQEQAGLWLLVGNRGMDPYDDSP